MPPLLRFTLYRLLNIPVTFFIVTATLFGVILLEPAESRAELYIPPRTRPSMTSEQYQHLVEQIIKRRRLDDPYPLQYARWLGELLRGDWGWSPSLNGDVLEALVIRTPVTAELTLVSILALVPLGLASGVLAGWKRDRLTDRGFRLAAYASTAIPPFILGLLLLAVFYVFVRWFPPGRLDLREELFVSSNAFKTYTGLLTVDGLLNAEPRISLEALRHLVLPGFTLSLAHWATLGRITRASVIEELSKEYITTAHAKGLKPKAVLWRHAFQNAITPALASSALSAASLITGVFVVEVVFGFHGVSEIITKSLYYRSDAPAALGFAVYSVLLVLPVMFVMDVLRAVVDPRVRERISEL